MKNGVLCTIWRRKSGTCIFIRNLELSPVRGKFYEQNGSDGKSIKLFTMPYPSSGYQMAAEYLLMDAPKKIDMTFEVYTIYSHGKSIGDYVCWILRK